MSMDPNKPGALHGLFKKEDYEREAAKAKTKAPVVPVPKKREPRPAAITDLTGLSEGVKLPKKGCAHCMGTGWLWLHAIPLEDGTQKLVGRWTLCTCMTRKATTHSKFSNVVPHNPKPAPKDVAPKPFRYQLKTAQERADSGEWLSHREKREMRLRERLHKQIELEAKMKELGQGKLF